MATRCEPRPVSLWRQQPSHNLSSIFFLIVRVDPFPASSPSLSIHLIFTRKWLHSSATMMRLVGLRFSSAIACFCFSATATSSCSAFFPFPTLPTAQALASHVESFAASSQS